LSSTPFSKLVDAAKEAKFTVIPAADYVVVCRDATPTKSSTSKDMLKLSCKVIVGPHAGSNLLTQQTLTEDNPVAVAMFMKFLDAFGITEEFLVDLPPAEGGGPNWQLVCRELKGKTALAVVTVGEWNEEDRNYIDKFKRVPPAMAADVDAALAQAGGGGSDPFVAAGAPADPFAAAAAGGPAEKPAEEPF
jgi:hypothetical protein